MRWKVFLSRKRRESDLDAEIQHHLATEQRLRMERGEPAREAIENARRDFGNVGLVKEVTREIWGLSSLDRFFEDIRYGIRLLLRNGSFTLVVLLILMLGIGATTTVFSLVNAVLLRDLPVPTPNELVWFKDPGFS